MSRAEQMTAMWRRNVPVAEIAAQFGVLKPAIYRALRVTGALPPYAPKVAGGPGRPATGVTRRVYERSARFSHSTAGRITKSEMAALPRVARDPCPRCGTRADYGCAHMIATGLAIAGHEADLARA